MKRLTKQEIVVTNRIFNHTDDISDGYYGQKTIAATKGFVSQNYWIMFPVFNVNSLREGATFPTPNVYISFADDEIKDDNEGRVDGRVGVTYGNVDSMKWLGEVLRVKNAPYFIKTLNAMEGWSVNVYQKIKTNFRDNTPIYKVMESFDAKDVTAMEIKTAIKNSNDNLLKVGDTYDGELILWCVTVFSVEVQTSADDFDEKMKKAFDLFIRVLSLR